MCYDCSAKCAWNWRKIVEGSAEFSFYVDIRMYIGVGMDVSVWFLVNVAVRLYFVMSLFLNVYVEGTVQEVNARAFLKWLKLLRADGGRFEINKLLFTDDTALVADSEKFRGLLRVNLGEYAKEKKLE